MQWYKEQVGRRAGRRPVDGRNFSLTWGVSEMAGRGWEPKACLTDRLLSVEVLRPTILKIVVAFHGTTLKAEWPLKHRVERECKSTDACRSAAPKRRASICCSWRLERSSARTKLTSVASSSALRGARRHRPSESFAGENYSREGKVQLVAINNGGFNTDFCAGEWICLQWWEIWFHRRNAVRGTSVISPACD